MHQNNLGWEFFKCYAFSRVYFILIDYDDLEKWTKKIDTVVAWDAMLVSLPKTINLPDNCFLTCAEYILYLIDNDE